MSDSELENDVFDLAYKVIKKNRELSKENKALRDQVRELAGSQMKFDLSKTTITPPYTINPTINTGPIASTGTNGDFPG